MESKITIPYKDYKILVADADRNREDIQKEVERRVSKCNEMRLDLVVWKEDVRLYKARLPLIEHNIHEEAKDEIYKTVNEALEFIESKSKKLKEENRVIKAVISALVGIIVVLSVIIFNITH